MNGDGASSRGQASLIPLLTGCPRTHFNYKLLMINDKLKTEAVSYGQLFNRLRRCFVVFDLSPQVIEHLAQRAQIPFIIYHLSFFIYNSLFSDSLSVPAPKD
jgi:hypothetical protein